MNAIALAKELFPGVEVFDYQGEPLSSVEDWWFFAPHARLVWIACPASDRWCEPWSALQPTGYGKEWCLIKSDLIAHRVRNERGAATAKRGIK